MFSFMNIVRSSVNYAIFRELCDQIQFEVDCAKSHHRIISEGLSQGGLGEFKTIMQTHHRYIMIS